MSQHIIQYTVEALFTISNGSLVCIALTVTSCGCLVSEQKFGKQVQSKPLSDPAAVKCGLNRFAWLSKHQVIFFRDEF